ncbi:sugar ABC transporter substrate-binding protein [Saccharopolyspora sp. ASAGF58]|nr:sugar ABC transporter substrate-binding protein [Saccharopolyspora sp. ASAGF58]
MRCLRLAIAAAAAMVLVTACGESDPSGAGGTDADVAAVVEQAKKNIEANFAGTDREMPKSGPKAVPGKKVWAIACSLQGSGCALPANGAAAAGKHLGWDVKVVDGKLDPNVYNQQIRAAIADKADAIMLFSVDCAATKGAISEAHAAGIVVFGANALDCDDKFAGGGERMFDGHLPWGKNLDTYGEFLSTVVGPAIADWVIAKTNGEAFVVELKQDDLAVTRHVGESFRARMAECSTCTVESIPYTSGDIFSGKLQGKTAAGLSKFPKANVVMSPLDANIPVGVGAAVEQARKSGRSDLLLAGHEGSPSSLELLRSGVQNFAVGRPMTWLGWAAADSLNRLFAGEDVVDSGIGIKSMDSASVPDVEEYDGNQGADAYQQNYIRIWQGK